MAAFLFCGALALHAFAAPTPAPYASSQAQLATSNALGGVGQTYAWTAVGGVAGTTAAVDVLATANIPSGAIAAHIVTTANAVATRVITLSRNTDDGTDSHLTICAQLGNDNVWPSVPTAATNACAAVGGSINGTAYMGGCVLTSGSPSCQFTIRPQVSGCTSWATCHTPLWVIADSGAGAYNVTVMVSL